jgi:hypothetical protein
VAPVTLEPSTDESSVTWVLSNAANRANVGGEAVDVNDRLDVSVHDSEVLAEIELMTNLIIATSESDQPLSQQRIDEILGVWPTIPRARQG